MIVCILALVHPSFDLADVDSAPDLMPADS